MLRPPETLHSLESRIVLAEYWVPGTIFGTVPCLVKKPLQELLQAAATGRVVEPARQTQAASSPKHHHPQTH